MQDPTGPLSAFPTRVRVGVYAVCGALFVAGIACIVVAAGRLVGDEWLSEQPLARAGFVMSVVGVLAPVRLRSWRPPAAAPAAVASGRYTLVRLRSPMSRARVRVFVGAIVLGAAAFVTLMILCVADVAPRSWMVGVCVTIAVAALLFRASERDGIRVDVASIRSRSSRERREPSGCGFSKAPGTSR